MTTPNSITAIQSRGRTFYICALLLSTVMLFEPIFFSVIYLLVFNVALRGGFFSLQIAKGRFVIIAEIIVIGFILLSIGMSFVKPSPSIRLDSDPLSDFLKVIVLLYIIWVLIFSKSVKEFIVYQIKYFRAREMKNIQEDKGRAEKG